MNFITKRDLVETAEFAWTTRVRGSRRLRCGCGDSLTCGSLGGVTICGRSKELHCTEFTQSPYLPLDPLFTIGSLKMKIMLWGGRSMARITIEMISEIYQDRVEIVGVFDKNLQNLPFESNINLYTDKPGFEYLCENSTHFVVCIGGEHGYARFNTAQKLIEKGLEPLSLISEYGLLHKLEECGQGIQVMPGAIVHKFSSLGSQCILNTNSTVDHECVLGDGVHIMGGASIAGRVAIGDFSTVGTNATILPDLKIGRNVYVGAGAVVIKDIEDNTVVVGVPGKPIKKIYPSFDSTMFD